jgi:hypothetical protein
MLPFVDEFQAEAQSLRRQGVGEHVDAGDLEIWTEQVGEGPDVLLIGGLGDTVESWQFQLEPPASIAEVVAS